MSQSQIFWCLRLDQDNEGYGPSALSLCIVADTLRLNDDICDLRYRRCQPDSGWICCSSIQRGHGLAAISSQGEDSREEG